MSLKTQFSDDLDATFFNPEEFGERHFEQGVSTAGREFEIIEDGQPVRFITNCVWDTETLRNRMIVQQQGVFLGTVLLFIHKNLFKVEPRPDQILYTPVTPFKIGWRILDVLDAEECYEISLDKVIA